MNASRRHRSTHGPPTCTTPLRRTQELEKQPAVYYSMHHGFQIPRSSTACRPPNLRQIVLICAARHVGVKQCHGTCCKPSLSIELNPVVGARADSSVFFSRVGSKSKPLLKKTVAKLRAGITVCTSFRGRSGFSFRSDN